MTKPRRRPLVSVWKSRYTGHWCRQTRGNVGATSHPTWAAAMGLDDPAPVSEPCS